MFFTCYRKNIRNSIQKIDVSYGKHLKYALDDNRVLEKDML